MLTSSGSPIALRFPGQWFQSESGLTDTYSGTVLRQLTYGWTARDNLASVTDQLGGTSGSYGQSPRDFLATATGAWDRQTFTYEAVGNSLSRNHSVAVTPATKTYGDPATSKRYVDPRAEETIALISPPPPKTESDVTR